MKKIASLLLVLLLLLGAVMLLASCDAGKSAYDIAVEHGFVGTEEEWLASLKGAAGEKGETGEAGAKGDTGEKGETGAKGESGDQGIVTPVPNGVKDVSFAYKWTEKGQVMVCTITMDDGSVVERECLLPEKVEKITADTNYIPLGAKNPAILITPYYEEKTENSGSGMLQSTTLKARKPIPLTEDMIISGSLDFSVAGTKELTVFYGGATTTVTVKVYDPQNVKIDRVVTSFYDRQITDTIMMNGRKEAVFVVSDGTTATYDMTGLYLEVEYDNGTTSYVPLTEEMLSLASVEGAPLGTYVELYATYEGVRSTDPFLFYFGHSVDMMSWEICGYYPAGWMEGDYYNSLDVVSEKGASCDLGYLGYQAQPSSSDCDVVYYYLPVTAEMLSCQEGTFDSTQPGVYHCTVSHSLGGVSCNESLEIGIYDETSIAGMHPTEMTHLPTATVGALPEITLAVMHVVGGESVYEYVKLTPEMLAAVPDCTTEGEKIATVTYKGTTNQIFFEISRTADTQLWVHSDFTDILITDTFPTICVNVVQSGSQYVILLTEDMLKEPVSFATHAKLTLKVLYQGLEYELTAYAYDPAVTMVKNAYIVMGAENLEELTVGVTAQDVINILLGAELRYSLFGESNDPFGIIGGGVLGGGILGSGIIGSLGIKTKKITADMIDLSAVDFTKPGEYTYTVTFDGYVLEEQLTLSPDFSTATLLYTLQGALTPMDSPAQYVLYDNGYYKEVSLYGGDEFDAYTFDAASGLLILETYYGKARYTVTLDGGTATTGSFARDTSLDAVAPVASYTFEIEGTAGSIVLANADYAIVSMIEGAPMPLVTCEYSVSEDGSTLSCFGMAFAINGDGTLTPLD